MARQQAQPPGPGQDGAARPPRHPPDSAKSGPKPPVTGSGTATTTPPADDAIAMADTVADARAVASAIVTRLGSVLAALAHEGDQTATAAALTGHGAFAYATMTLATAVGGIWQARVRLVGLLEAAAADEGEEGEGAAL